jgi:hypothetical protein
MSIQSSSATVPGEVAAALIAGGAGSLILGFVVVLAEASSTFSGQLSIYPPTGSLSGKVALAVVGWLTIWLVLHFRMRNREIPTGKMIRVLFILVAMGLIGTFPPFFYLFG